MERQRWALLGASRGLGKTFLKLIDRKQNLEKLLFISRKEALMKALSKELQTPHLYEVCDLSQNAPLETLKRFSPHKIFYFAGGGPFGPFSKKEFKDHMWAWHVNFLTPAKILHHFLETDLQQMVILGSHVAETGGDLYSASYTSAKKALLCLCESIMKEKPKLDLRVYSPSYMNTDLLPKNSKPRKDRQPLLEPEDVALDLLRWSLTEKKKHHKLKLHREGHHER